MLRFFPHCGLDFPWGSVYDTKASMVTSVKSSFVFDFELEICDVLLQEGETRLIPPELLFSIVCYAHNIQLLDQDMKQNHICKIFPSPFHATAYIAEIEKRFTQWAHYCLIASVFCIWRADKPVVISYTHRPMHNAHNEGLMLCSLAWSFISCFTWFNLHWWPDAYPCKR